MIRSASLVSLAFLAVGLAACTQAQAPGLAPLSTEDEQAIRQISDQFGEAFLARDAAAVAALYTEDAVLLPEGAPAVEGRAAIEEFFRSFPPVTDAELTIDDIDGCGDLAYVRGRIRMTVAPEGAEPVEQTGKFIEIRRRQADGRWLLAADIFNLDAPAPAPSEE